MSSPTAQWDRVMRRAGIKPLVLVQVDLDGTPTSRKFVSGTVPLFGYQPLVASFEPNAVRVNPIPPRRVQCGDVTIKFKDSLVIRDLIKNNPLRGHRVKVFLGCKELTSESDWYQIFAGAFDDHAPEIGRVSIDVRALDAFGLVVDKEISFQTPGTHPLTAIALLLDQKLHVPSELIDSTSLDPDDVAYSTNIGHWQVMREWVNGVDDRRQNAPQNGLTAIEEAAALCNGTLVPTNDGKIRFARYDHASAVVATWDKTKIRGLRQRENTGTLINQAEMFFGWTGGGDAVTPESGTIWAPHAQLNKGEWRYSVKLTDDDSIARYVFGSTTAQEFLKTISSKWTGVISHLDADITAGAGTVVVADTFLRAFCGSRPSGANAAPSANRPVYLRIDEEIIKFDAVVLDTTVETIPPDTDEEGNPHSDTPDEGVVASAIGGYTPGALESNAAANGVGGGAEVWRGTYTVAAGGRGAAGTAAAAHSKGAEVLDVTIAVQLLAEIIGRCSDGLQIIELDVPIYEISPDYGQNVGITHDAFLAYGYDGLAGTEKWEVIGKKINPGEACITYTLASVRTPPSVTSTWTWPSQENRTVNEGVWHGVGGRLVDWFRNSAGNFLPHVADGLIPSQTSGRNIQITGGSLLVNGIPREVAARTTDYQLPASKDTYIWFDVGRGVYIRESVANGAAAPSTPASAIPVAMAATDGSNVTGITDLRPRTNTQLLAPLLKDTSASPVGDVKLKNLAGLLTVTDDADVEATASWGSKHEFTKSFATTIEHSDGQPYALVVDREETNYIRNPSFEVDLTGWQEVSPSDDAPTLARITTDKVFGTACLWVDSNDATPTVGAGIGAEVTNAYRADAANGETWTASAWVKLGAGTQTVRISVVAEKNDGTVLTSQTTDYIVGTDWIRVHGTHTTTDALTTKIRVSIFVVIAVGTTTFDLYIDGVQLEKSANPSSYFDGSFGDTVAGFGWTGTAHDSSSTRAGGVAGLGPTAEDAPPFVVFDDGEVSCGPITPSIGTAAKIGRAGSPLQIAGAGTAFPSAPSTNDTFFRTDRGVLYYYDGTRWLSVAEYALSLGSWLAGNTSHSASSGGNPTHLGACPAHEGTTQVFVTQWVSELFIGATNSGTHNWTYALADAAAATIASWNSSAYAAGAGWVRHVVDVDSVRTVATDKHWMTLLTKNSSPTNVNAVGGAVHYRLIG